MAAVRLEHISRRFGSTTAVDDVSLEITDREVVTIVGPSGCGKSTLLRIVAGLETPSSGEVFIDGKAMNGVPTQQRNIAMVFQSYALYPHLTCYENLSLNLKLKKVSADEIDRRVRETARTLEIEDLLRRRPKELSGGQRQRVAVGRALIRKPAVYLFDEPLSNLDAFLRERVRHELKELFERVQATAIYVTHDQIEALTLAHRVVVLEKGRVQQIGTPEELYRFPANRFVASFIGSPTMNLFPVMLQKGHFELRGEQIDTKLDFNGTADAGIRPEAVRLGGPINAEILWMENLGLQFLIGLRAGNIELTALVPEKPNSQSVGISLDAKDVHVFDKQSGENISRRGVLRPAGF